MRQTKRLKLYLDTTIPSYVYALDTPQRMEITRQFMRSGRSNYEMVISDVVIAEIHRAAILSPEEITPS